MSTSISKTRQIGHPIFYKQAQDEHNKRRQHKRSLTEINSSRSLRSTHTAHQEGNWQEWMNGEGVLKQLLKSVEASDMTDRTWHYTTTVKNLFTSHQLRLRMTNPRCCVTNWTKERSAGKERRSCCTREKPNGNRALNRIQRKKRKVWALDEERPKRLVNTQPTR